VAFQQIPGGGLWLPNDWFGVNGPPSANNSATIAATGDLFAWVGRVWFRERTGTKNIRNAAFHFGTSGVVKSGGSGLTVSLQDVSLTAGPPMQPDGIKDQTFAIANGNTSFAANGWLQGTFNASRTVAYGEMLALVIEFDGAGRLGSDSFAISGITPAVTTLAHMQSQGVTRVSSVFTVYPSLPNIALTFDDNTVGTMYGGFPSSLLSSHTYGNATAGADEYAMGIQLPFPAKISGALVHLLMNAGADCSVILYSGTTALQTVAIDSNAVALTGGGGDRMIYVPIPETALAANTLYFLAVRPDTANTITTYYCDMALASHLQAHGGGPAWSEYSRLDGGAWNATVTPRQPFFAVELSAFDDGASGGGGTGGMIQSRVRTGY
jgi:hypothetical protein